MTLEATDTIFYSGSTFLFVPHAHALRKQPWHGAAAKVRGVMAAMLVLCPSMLASSLRFAALQILNELLSHGFKICISF